MFNKVLIANRGAIACRVIRSLKKWGFNQLRFIRKRIGIPCM